ncbi:hypothetical protein TSAR_013314 [Trichomalopsis sarcophagae]|uniref:TIL domain-containing protein n=1 Tax=Trichomalopsis sarcophagae TaxID=543379 RepID=A0A232EMG9_9HYME|nr:hypothetical protein TSAR_013314 [Trichomalopsis sarcophagae]
MKTTYLILFILVVSSVYARNKCSSVSDCFQYCRGPGEVGNRAKDASCINNYCVCGKPVEICFSGADCFSYCGVNPDPDVPRDKDVMCSEKGICECRPIY